MGKKRSIAEEMQAGFLASEENAKRRHVELMGAVREVGNILHGVGADIVRELASQQQLRASLHTATTGMHDTLLSLKTLAVKME